MTPPPDSSAGLTRKFEALIHYALPFSRKRMDLLP